MSKLVIDVETSILNKGNPFTQGNQLVVIGILNVTTNTKSYYWSPFDIQKIQQEVNSASLLIGFNIKFDLHWLRRYGIVFDLLTCKVWDCQLAEFILEAQSNPYPSLNKACMKYGFPLKIDVVKEQYWDNGIDTTLIPRNILTDYLASDLDRTYDVYATQEEQLQGNQLKLFSLQCQDLLILEDMEFNGMCIDTEKAAELNELELQKTVEIERELRHGYENIPINWDSGDHLSCFLYGGTITEIQRIPIGVYKTGAKVGQPRYKLVEYNYELPRQVVPLSGSELKKDGYYATNDTTLKSIKGTARVRGIINKLLERAKSVKLSGTYFGGLPKLIAKMDWPHNKLHGQFNQCVAATGRLSSSNPNLQNFAKDVKQLLVSRYN